MKKPDLNKVKGRVVNAGNKAFNTAKDVGDRVAVRAGKAKDDFAIWHNKPVTLKDFKAKLPEVLHVMDQDIRFEDPLFKNAIGFQDDVKNISAVRILTKNTTKKLGLTLKPVADEGVYLQDPFNPLCYINVNDYFDYIRQERIAELTEIAQKLGAENIKVTLNEEKQIFASQKKNSKTKVKVQSDIKKENGYLEIGADKEAEEKEYKQVDVLTEMHFPGGEPKEPEVIIFRNHNMESLIRMRLNEENRLKGKYLVKMKYLTSVDYNITKARSIDAALKKWKMVGDAKINATTEEVVQASNRLEIVYQIEFPK